MTASAFCRGLTYKDNQLDGERLVRVFRLNMCRTFLRFPRVLLGGKNLLDSALHRLGPSLEESGASLNEGSLSRLSYSSVTSTIERFSGQEVRDTCAEILHSLWTYRFMDDLKKDIPFCFAWHYNDRTIRRRVYRPTVITKYLGVNCFLFQDYDGEVRCMLEKA